MGSRPRSIVVIGWLFIAMGTLTILADVPPLATHAAAVTSELALVWAIRLLSVVGGAFILRGFNWARWLLVAWMGYHVALSVLHTPFELAVHGVLFVVLCYFLFRRDASVFFRRAGGAPS